jgi:GT2 family glycosyltransferase
MATSIVVPHFGDPRLTIACVEAVVRHSPPVELVIVDNGGNLQGRFVTAFQVAPPRNLGFAGGCNLGARIANGDVLVFLNNDCTPHPGWLEPLLAALADPGTGVAGAKLLYGDGRIQHSGIGIDFAKPPGREAWNRTDEHPSEAVDAVTGACLAIRAADFREVGGFDVGFWNGYEDCDLCLAVKARDRRCWYAAESVVTHLESRSGPERWRAVRENVDRLRSKWAAAAA